ncbi:MAG: tRNA 2-thiocytidine biosynthesis protein TtcA [Herbinix sp.]|nr:tRNA 2-thiocytidine biosynthesis protein TtcA [Herbinix sp.]
MERYQEIERNIITKFRKPLWKKFINGVNDYKLIEEGDKIAVCISGGKDSMLLAKLMQEVQRHGKLAFELEFIVMDPGYNEINRQTIVTQAKLLNIPIRIFETQIWHIVAEVDQSPCYLCARMRRGYLYKNAQELGCNKIALGHHFDDVIETVLMGMLYAGQIQTMMPKLHSTNHPGMQLIRPMYLVKEADILAWKQYNDLQFIQCACRFTENCTISDNAGGGSKRQEMKSLIKKFRQTNPSIDMNIFRSIHDVNLDTIIGHHDRQHQYNFLDDYESKARIKPEND